MTTTASHPRPGRCRAAPNRGRRAVMPATLNAPPTVLRLHAQTAADLMASNPISLRAEATIEEAMTLFAEKGIAAAPVIDAGGRPIGVISRPDLFIHQVEEARRQRPDYFFNPEAEHGPRHTEPVLGST